MQRWLRGALCALVLFVPCAAWADGLIVIPRPMPNVRAPFPLSVRYHRVDVAIDDAVARTSVDQEFFNPTQSRLEGYYIFPLPAGAVIRDFSMEIDGKQTPAELLDAAKARTIYEDIVRSMRDPALLEYIGSGAFRVRIFPIEPRSGKRVKLSYSQVVPRDAGVYAYTYPLNTEKFSAAPVEDVSVRVALKSKHGLKTIYCPTHEVEIRRKSELAAVVGFEEKQTRPDTDFTLYYSTDDQDVGVSVLTHRPPGEDGYFLLTVTPAYDRGATVAAKDITFVLDVSGSMSGEKMAQARRAIRFCLDRLNPNDRFEVIRFSTEAEALFGRLEKATPANVAKAQAYVRGLEAIGGTNAEEALSLALEANAGVQRASSARSRVVLFITDGKPTIGETDGDRLVKKVRDANAGNLRVFTFGIGDDLNTHFLDKLTEATRAARTYVGEKEDIELPVSAFYEKIQSPVLVDLALDFGSTKAMQTYPRDLPDLFKGSQLTVFGRYRGTGDALTLTGTVDGRRVTLPYTARFPAREDGNALLAPLWAAQRIGYLLDQIRLHGEEKELVDEVTRLARRFGILTPYTSYLIMEDERVRVARNVLLPANQTVNAVSAADAQFSAELRREYTAMQSEAGAPSVQASKEVEALKNATNQARTKQGAARMQYQDAKGATQNLSTQTKNVQGRAVYQVGSNWIDSRVQSVKNQKVNRVQFASAAYFELLQKEPKAAEFLALGRNVRFAVGEAVYEVYE